MKNTLIAGYEKRFNALCEESLRADKALLFTKWECGISAEEELRAVIGDLERLAGIELRYNPYHDEYGRFASADGAAKRYSNGGAKYGNDKKPEKALDKSENSGIIKSYDNTDYISATGPNEFKKGFSTSNLADHWIGNEKVHGHKDEYPNMTMEQYADRALTLVQMPTSKTIRGYKTSDGCVVRYDSIENDFVKGHPNKGIKTMFKPINGEKYYYEKEKSESYN